MSKTRGGMMWLETNPKTSPEQTLAEAMTYYVAKYGQTPTLACVPLNWPEMNGSTPPGLSIERTPLVRPGHVWLIVTVPLPQDSPHAD